MALNYCSDGVRVSLLVKGRYGAATEAVRKSLRRASDVRYRGVTRSGDASIVHATVPTIDPVVGWFASPAECIPGRGFPPGTLLHYSTLAGV